VLLTYRYLGTTTEAIAGWYRAIVPREDRIPQSEWCMIEGVAKDLPEEMDRDQV
jgi:hypothetical protein